MNSRIFIIYSLLVILCSAGTSIGFQPTCVEVVDISPKPFSMFPVKENIITFIVTFSKNVTRINSGKDVFLTPSLNDLVEIYPKKSRHFFKNYEFQFSRLEIKQYRKVYFILDGGSFTSLHAIVDGYWNPFVPLSIFGVYYISNPPPDVKPLAISPPTYCYPRDLDIYKRPRFVTAEPFVIDISENESQIVKSGEENFKLLLSVLVSTNGNGSTILPQLITVSHKGHNVTVLIPAKTELYIDRNEMFYLLALDRKNLKIVHEVIERVYHSRLSGLVQQKYKLSDSHPFTKKDWLRYPRENYDYRSFRYSTLATNKVIILTHKPSTLHNTYYYSYAASFRAKKEAIDGKPFNYPYNPVWHVCDSNSTRSSGLGRQGTLYHTLELGRFYQIFTPIFNRSRYFRRTKVYVNSKEVKIKYYKPPHLRSGLPSNVENVLRKYVVLSPIRINEEGYTRTRTEDMMFVPKSQVHNRCNGILLFENFEKFNNDKDFCNKPFGDCIGLPFGRQRFPPIPPFGLPNVLVQVSKIRIDLRMLGGLPIMINEITIPGIKILLPSFESVSCDSIWSLNAAQSSITTEYQSRLMLRLLNNGEGGADVTVIVKCTAYLEVFPFVGIKTQFVGPGEELNKTFLLDASRAQSRGRQPHKCNMDITIHLPTMVNDTQNNITCSKVITTYAGDFQDPCLIEETPLPEFNLKYFVLPPSQRESTSLTISDFLQSKAGADYVFVKAITVSLTLKKMQNDLVSNLNLLHVRCKKEAAIIIEEEELLNAAGKEAFEQETFLLESTFNYYSSFTNRRKMYYFAKKSWLNQFNKDNMDANSELSSSGCVVQLFANRPTRHCHSNLVNLKTVLVPLVKSDIATLSEELRNNYWYLETIYGEQTDEIKEFLLECIALSVFMYSITAISYFILFSYRKKLPNRGHLWSKQQHLKKIIAKDRKRWENPQMYLESGAFGPYYTLHDFKCTHPLDNLKKLKLLKVAGLLRFKEKEQQILFGHVKKVFVSSRKKGSGYVLLQASSGMYLLKPENVHHEYLDEMESFYKRNKIKVKNNDN